jgi:site-specific recombinase XerD
MEVARKMTSNSYLRVVDTNVRLRNDGRPKLTHTNTVKGRSNLVQPIKDEEDFRKFFAYFDQKINQAKSECKRLQAIRNRTLIEFGFESGLRGSDVVCRTWGDVLYDDYTFRKTIRVQAKKTKKYGNFVLNDRLRRCLTELFNANSEPPKLTDWIFPTQQTDDHISRAGFWNIVKTAQRELGLKENIGTHSLRKTFGFNIIESNASDPKALATLQRLFGHSSEAITLRYCGLDEEDDKRLFSGLSNIYDKKLREV